MNRNRAFTLIELLVVMAIIAILLGLLLPAINKARQQTKSLKDSTQINQVHKGWMIYANEADGRFPTPGLINRKPFQTVETPGRGDEDLAKNDSANMYSASIMRNLYQPELLVGPTEINAYIIAKTNYNYNAYNPPVDVYWDGDGAAGALPGPPPYLGPDSFPVNFASRSVVSYAHSPIAGARKSKEWRFSGTATYAVVGTRGPEDGLVDYASTGGPGSPARSLTLELHAAKNSWEGNICYNDNHMRFEISMFPEAANFRDIDGITKADNLFKRDKQGTTSNFNGDDTFLCLVRNGGVDAQGVVNEDALQWD